MEELDITGPRGNVLVCRRRISDLEVGVGVRVTVFLTPTSTDGHSQLSIVLPPTKRTSDLGDL